MAGPDRRAGSAVAVSVFLGFTAAFVLALLEFRGSNIIGRFALRWELARAASLLAAWMPPLLFAACAASMSLHTERGLRFSQLVRPVLVPALVLALLFSGLELTILPSVRRIQLSYESLSALFLDAMEEAEEALKAGNIPRAQERVALCGAIDNTETSYKLLNERIQKAFLQSERQRSAPGEVRAPERIAPDSGASAYEFYRRALRYFQEGDYYSAHWYAGKAVILDPSRRDARLLQADAWKKITSFSEDPADRARAEFHARKAHAYSLLQSGDYLGSYRAFTDLARENPKDPDISRYRKESLERLSETTFFADDYRRAFAGRSADAFAVRISLEDSDHVLFASRVARAGSFLYFEEFEYLRADARGPALHVRAPYAQLRGIPGGESRKDAARSSTVSLRRVERNAPREATLPEYLAGSPGPAGQAVLEVPLDFESLSTLLTLREETLSVPFSTLLEGSRIAERYGWDSSPYRLETALRISIPFVLVALALLGTAMGARFRRDEEPGQLRLILTLPLLTFLASVPLEAGNRAGQHVLARLFAGLPPPGAMAAWVVLLAILLVASLLAAGRLGVHASD